MAVSVIIGGQYGSEGKGKVSQFIADNYSAKAIIRVGGPNSGHTVYHNGEKHILRHLSHGIFSDIPTILPVGSYIDVDVLMSEIEKYDIKPHQLMIHPNAYRVTSLHKKEEEDNDMSGYIGSTQSGLGEAVRHRIQRDTGFFASTDARLEPYITNTESFVLDLLLICLFLVKKHISNMDPNKPYVVVLSSVNFSTAPQAMKIICESKMYGISSRECSIIVNQVFAGIPSMVNSFSTRSEAEELVNKFLELGLKSEIIDKDTELEKIVYIQERQIEYMNMRYLD